MPHVPIDLIDILCLEELLSPVEIDDLTDSLAKEIWYRILNEELPKQLSPAELAVLLKTNNIKQDLNAVLQWVHENKKNIDMAALVDVVSTTVKQEYITTYIIDLKQSYVSKQQSDEKKAFMNIIDRIENELKNDSPDFQKIKNNIHEAYVYKKLIDT